MAERFVYFVCFLLFCFPLFGQRVYEKIEPAEADESFGFDINEFPVSRNILEIGGSLTGGGATRDLNFSPNIVLSPNLEKAFVSAPGSDRVLVFHPRTGEILNSLQVPANPTELVLSPDETQIAVISIRAKDNLPKPGGSLEFEGIGALSLIDVETSQVRTMELTEVVFSIGNNPVFSADGSTIFVASSRTDQLLRIDAETLQESGPRMDLPEGTRPSSITMAPDYSFMTLVLVGSSNLPRLEVPDSIKVIDPNTFSELYTIVPETGPGNDEALIHDFTVANRIAISPDGKYGMLADQQSSSVSVSPELATDRAWLIDFDQREVVKIYNVGGIAGGTYWVPDGRFLVICALEASFINPSADTATRFQPLRSDFRPYSRPTFSSDGTFMYLASPTLDSILVFRLGTGEITHPVEVGGEIEVDIGGQATATSSAPMTLAMTPDGSALVALNYNANTIELLGPTERQFISRILSSEEFFTGVAITNLSSSEAEVIVSGYSNGGLLFTDDEETEDVVEFVNPITLEIPPGAQVAQTAIELVTAADDPSIQGWFELDSPRARLSSFFLIGDRAGKRLDGGIATFRAGKRIFVPEIRVADGMVTELSVLNPDFGGTSVSIGLYGADGELIEQVSRNIPARAAVTSFVRDPDPDDATEAGLFAEDSFEDFEHGYIVVSTGTQGIVAYNRYYDADRMASLNGFNLTLGEHSSTVLYGPQVAFFDGNEANVNLINTHPKDGDDDEDQEAAKRISANIQLKGNDGLDLAAPVDLTLEAGEAVRADVAELFGLEDTGSVVGGWLLIETDKRGLVGDVELRLFDGRAMTAVPLQNRLASEMVFSHVAEGLGLSTGLSLINPGTETAEVTVEVHETDGDLVQSTLISLTSGSRVANLLDEIFPEEFPEQLGGYVRVVSTQPIVGLELFFADDLEMVSAVPAQLVQPDDDLTF